VKAREVIRRLKRDGWYLDSQEGSHRHFEHPTKRSKITIAFKDGEDIPDYVVRRILRDAGL
jgi:predicted RNA binding protein YcfA (HicA-like mRNA interferase family)